MSEAMKNYYKGLKLSEVAPFLKQIAKQNGLRLSVVREFNIAKRILTRSIVIN